MAAVRIANLVKSYGAHRVLDVPALEVGEGEFFSLLGPSGCGKTTTLRCIAGLVEPDAGRIAIGSRHVTGVPTAARNVGMVFQRYALFPHLTVRENVAYGLHGRGLERQPLEQRVRESLDQVALGGFDDRYPHQMSGGQQQRVAMARAIAYRPDVLLLDEPFSNPDAKLRTTLRADLKQLQQALGITTVFVTHDQQEALALSDRLAVMHEGRVEQVGTPEDVYESPASAFVADFVGATNLLRATVVEIDGRGGVRLRLDDCGTLDASRAGAVTAGSQVTLVVKPERIRLVALPARDATSTEPLQGGRDDAALLTGEIATVSYLGSAYSYMVLVGGQRVEARQANPVLVETRRAAAGDRVSVHMDTTGVRVLPT